MAHAVPDGHEVVGTPARRRSLRPLRIQAAVLPAAVLAAVVICCYRPWQQGLLEEWGLEQAWEAQGWAGYTSRLPLTIGRPFHLLPAFLGFALSNGGFVGIYGVLTAAMVATAILVATTSRRWIPSPSARWLLAAAIALHPWWPAGSTLRFLPASVSLLAFAAWFVLLNIHAREHSRVALPVATLVLVYGLLTYQALAGTAVIAAAAVVLIVRPSRARAVAGVLATGFASGGVLLYSTVIAPHLSSTAYESTTSEGLPHLAPSLRQIARTTLHAPETVILGLLALVAIAAVIAANRRVTAASLVLIATTLLAPLAGLAYAGSSLHLRDPERVALPVGAVLWVVLVLAVALLADAREKRQIVLVLTAVATAVLAITGYQRWAGFAHDQHLLLEAVEEVRDEVPAGGSLIVADTSGRYGDVYTLLPPTINEALSVDAGPGPYVTLCTADGYPHVQPDAARFPIVATPDCSSVADFDGNLELLSTVPVNGGLVSIYAVPAP